MTWRTRAAWHEASHCACALHLGVQLHRVYIRQEGGIDGRCEYVVEPPAENRAVIVAAGPVGEAMASGEPINWNAGQDDWNTLVRLADRSSGGCRARSHDFMAHAIQRARVILAENWPAVERLAAALLRFGHIDGRSARALFEESRHADC